MRVARAKTGVGPRAAVISEDAVRVQPDDVDVLDLLTGHVTDRAESELALADAQLLAPIEPPTIRDFSVFEQHIEGAIKTSSPEAPVPPVWYERPYCYFSNPYAITGPGENIRMAPGTQALDLELEVAAIINGVELGGDTLANMAWSFDELVAYASRGTWVRPGDTLGSGTCGSGCLLELWGRRGGIGDPPPPQVGDVVTLRVEGIGELTNRVVEGFELIELPPARTTRTRA